MDLDLNTLLAVLGFLFTLLFGFISWYYQHKQIALAARERGEPRQDEPPAAGTAVATAAVATASQPRAPAASTRWPLALVAVLLLGFGGLAVWPMLTASAPDPAPAKNPSPASPPAVVVDGPPEFVNGLGMTLVRLPAGEFGIGSPEGELGRHALEGPRHRARVPAGLYVARHEVTQAQFERVLQHNPSSFGPGGPDRAVVAGLDLGKLPVDSVTHAEAEQFCRALAALPEERAAKRSYRLPTEVEWEYAARAGAAG